MNHLLDDTIAHVHGVALRMLGDAALAERVVANTYARVLSDERACLGGSPSLALLVACREAALQVLRENPGAAPPESDLALAFIEDSEVHAQLMNLDPAARRLVALALLRGLSNEELASFTHLAPGDIAGELRRAIAKLGNDTGFADLDEVLITGELQSRAARSPDHAAENRALRAMAASSTDPPQRILQRLVELASDLCHAHSAGVSVLESDGADAIFRWNVVVGAFAQHVGGSLPRHESPCGIVIDRDETLLVRRPERHFTRVRDIQPRIEEVLLVPFHLLGEPIGTLWMLSHDDSLHFDGEDSRVLGSLAEFASAAYLMRCAEESAFSWRDELIRSNERLRAANDRLGVSREPEESPAS